mgnify:CR=1 FL=1
MKHFKFNIDEILQPQDWGFPVPIAYGPGRIKEISTFCKNLNIQNPLIVTDTGSKDLTFIENLKKILIDANINTHLIYGLLPNTRSYESTDVCCKFR